MRTLSATADVVGLSESVSTKDNNTFVAPTMEVSDTGMTKSTSSYELGGIKPEPVLTGKSIINMEVDSELLTATSVKSEPKRTSSGEVIYVDNTGTVVVGTGGLKPPSGGLIGGGGGFGGGGGLPEDTEAPIVKSKKFPYLLVAVAVVAGYLIFRKK
jgi:hypothetical protein